MAADAHQLAHASSPTRRESAVKSIAHEQAQATAGPSESWRFLALPIAMVLVGVLGLVSLLVWRVALGSWDGLHQAEACGLVLVSVGLTLGCVAWRLPASCVSTTLPVPSWATSPPPGRWST